MGKYFNNWLFGMESWFMIILTNVEWIILYHAGNRIDLLKNTSFCYDKS